MTTRRQGIADAINWEHAKEFSYREHVAQGLDYLCLFRSEQLTIKAYFWDDGCIPKFVVPHNHRYDFDSRLVCGSLREIKYMEHADFGERINRYKYDCIVDGGRGFFGPVLVNLVELSNRSYGPRDAWSNKAHVDIHTLAAIEPGTILLQTQYADKPPMRTLAWAHEIPNTDNVYRPMDEERIEMRVSQLQEALR